MQKNKAKATCTFVPEDVQSIFAVTVEEAADWLERNRKYIEERMCAEGHEAIRALGAIDGLTRTSNATE